MHGHDERLKKVLDRLIAAAGGILVALLAAIPLVGTLALFFGAYRPEDGMRILILPLFSVAGFGTVFALGVRSAVRRWRDVKKIQEIIGGMDESERKEFYERIEQSDVELVEGDDGKLHSEPLDHG